MEGGVMKLLAGFLDKQLEYTKNNLLRREFNLYLPDFDKLQTQIKTAARVPGKLAELNQQRKIEKQLGKSIDKNEGLKGLFKSEGT